MTRNEKILKAILTAIKSGDAKGARWQVIVEAVKEAGIKVTNWMDVRSILQFAINEKLIGRRRSTHEERYLIVDRKAFADWCVDLSVD